MIMAWVARLKIVDLFGKNWAGLRRNFEKHQICMSLFGNKLAGFPVVLFMFLRTHVLGLAQSNDISSKLRFWVWHL